jgi:hypothetical protein
MRPFRGDRMSWAMTVLEVRPQQAGWVVVEDGSEPLSRHATADAAVRAAQVVLAREPDCELVVLDRYARVVAVGPPQALVTHD